MKSVDQYDFITRFMFSPPLFLTSHIFSRRSLVPETGIPQSLAPHYIIDRHISHTPLHPNSNSSMILNSSNIGIEMPLTKTRPSEFKNSSSMGLFRHKDKTRSDLVSEAPSSNRPSTLDAPGQAPHHNNSYNDSAYYSNSNASSADAGANSGQSQPPPQRQNHQPPGTTVTTTTTTTTSK